jgi:hypothetical protein
VVAGALASVSLLPAAGAGATGGGSVQAVHCTTNPTDPPLEAPPYAQDEGASGGTDAWWCELPHATAMPAHYVELTRGVAPLTWPYSLYSTNYGGRSAKGKTTTIGTGTPGVNVTVDFNSTVAHAPGPLQYPKAPSGKKVTVSKGVTGTLVTSSNDIRVIWRYPTKGVPRYLQGVATVTVTGYGLPAATVLAVARHVRPD